MSLEQIVNVLLTHSPALIVAIPLLGAFLTPLISKVSWKLRNIFVIVVLALTELLVLLLANDIFSTSSSVRTYVFGAQDLALPVVRILFEVDGMSIFVGIISATLALVAVIYSWTFMKEQTGLDKYYTLILLMTAGMLGMEFTGDMFNFFVFLEITSISSCALIAFWTHKGESVESAFKYIVISALSALFVLFAVALLYGQYNALNIATLANALQFTFLDKIALVLLLIALAMKAGIVPLHMWLPDAYGRAPSSITLMLVGATQASLYAFFRVAFTLYGKSFTIIDSGINVLEIISWLFIFLAVLTMLIGVIMALRQTDFKRLIAYAAVAELGFMFLGLCVGLTVLSEPNQFNMYGYTAMQGGVFHIINDALDIGLLFLVAGAVYYTTQETSLNKIGGLARNMKYTSVFFLIGLLAVAGMPPLNGFASKLLIYESTYQLNPILSIIAIVASILLLAVFIKVFHAAFMGPRLPQLAGVKEAPKSMLLAMGIIASIIIIFGLFPNLVVESIVQPAADALVNQASYLQVVLGGV